MPSSGGVSPMVTYRSRQPRRKILTRTIWNPFSRRGFPPILFLAAGFSNGGRTDMAYVVAAPEMMTAAAADLATIGSNVSAAHMVAAARTTSVLPAAADEVSAGIAQLFSQHAANYQALAGQAAAFQEQFVQNLAAGAFSYANIEAAIAGALRPVIDAAIATGLPLLENGLNAVGQLVLAINVALPPSLAMLGAALVQFIEAFLIIGAFLGFILFFEFLVFIFALPVILANSLPGLLPEILAAFGI